MHRTTRNIILPTILYGLLMVGCLLVPWIQPAVTTAQIRILLLCAFLFSLGYAAFVYHLGHRHERDLSSWLQRLQKAMGNGSLPVSVPDTDRVLELARQHVFQRHMLEENFSSTAHVVAGAAERVARLLETADRTLERLQPAVQAVGSLSFDAIALADGASPDDSLSDRIARLRFELEHFTETPRKMLEQLQAIYQRYLTETDQLLTGQETLLDTLAGQLSRLEDQGHTLSHASQEVQEQLVALAEALQDLSKGTGNMAREWRHMETVLQTYESLQPALREAMSTCPTLVDQLKTQLLDLDTITNRTKILSLNATVYAADAGEEGLGFAAIAGEMKALAGESERTQQELRDTLAALASEIDASQESAQSLYTLTEQARAHHHAVHEQLTALQDAAGTLRQALTTARTRQEALDEQVRHHAEHAQAMHHELAEPRSQVAERRTDLSHAQALKYEIDHMIIETDRFSERLSGEMPLILESLGAVLDNVSSLQDQLTQMRHAIRVFQESKVAGNLATLRQQLNGPDARLLGDVPRMLARTRPRKPIVKTR